MSLGWRVAVGAVGGLAARVALAGVRATPAAAALMRTNFRGRPVSLAGGPALALSASASAALGAGSAPVAAAALVAGLGAGSVGYYDDLVGGRPEHQAKGFRGHLLALREGRVTSGLVKIVGVGAAGLVAAVLLPGAAPGRRRSGVVSQHLGWISKAAFVSPVLHTLLGAGVIAGSANLVNLLDLRPGRALKAGLLVGVPLAAGRRGGVAAGPVGTCAALLRADLGEEIMLGDAGANALGALLGVALASRTGTTARAVLLAGIVGLTAASEKISFTKVIEGTPGLRELDALGRRPA